jgi:hypothetical protein
MVLLGWINFAVSFVLLLIGITMSVTTDSDVFGTTHSPFPFLDRVYNIGLLQERQSCYILATGTAVVGAIFLGFGTLLNDIRDKP